MSNAIFVNPLFTKMMEDKFDSIEDIYNSGMFEPVPNEEGFVRLKKPTKKKKEK